MSGKTLICIKRGSETELVNGTLEIGELGFTTDTHKLFIGSAIGNLFLAKGLPPEEACECKYCFQKNGKTGRNKRGAKHNK